MDLKTRISDSTLRLASRSLKGRHHCVFGWGDIEGWELSVETISGIQSQS